MSKLVAVAATLTVSVAVPALLVQVGAIDAVGHELAAPAPSGAQVVVATSQAKPVAVPRRVARQARAAVHAQAAAAQPRVRVTAPRPARRISTPVSSVVSNPKPSTPSTPTTTTPTTTTPAPSTPTTTTTTPATPAPSTTTTVPPFTTTTVAPPEPPVTVPPPPKIVVVTVPPPAGTDIFHDGSPVAVAVTVKANIYAPPPMHDGVTP